MATHCLLRHTSHIFIRENHLDWSVEGYPVRSYTLEGLILCESPRRGMVSFSHRHLSTPPLLHVCTSGPKREHVRLSQLRYISCTPRGFLPTLRHVDSNRAPHHREHVTRLRARTSGARSTTTPLCPARLKSGVESLDPLPWVSDTSWRRACGRELAPERIFHLELEQVPKGEGVPVIVGPDCATNMCVVLWRGADRQSNLTEHPSLGFLLSQYPIRYTLPMKALVLTCKSDSLP
ncbi:hypothetical protein BC827DRAFT_874133 [Russula dissimulans]|nr:hypothetical protein BC827DRAFT_874133 [Russula dissimulans]